MQNPINFESIDESLRHGKIKIAAHQIAAAAKNNLSRPDRLSLAFLAQRAQIPMLGILLLRPMVRASPRNPIKATDEEKIAFAACLVGLGAVQEALTLLAPIDGVEHPSKLLFTAFGHFKKWDFKTSLPIMREYVGQKKLDEYSLLVGKLNLASALVYEKNFMESWPLLQSVIDEAKRGHHLRILGHALNISAEQKVYERSWEWAESLLEESSRIGETQGTLDELFYLHWKAVLHAYRASVSTLQLGQEFRAVRKLSLKLRRWEFLRDCDYHLCLANPSSKKSIARGKHLYFGTPHEAYRQRLLNEFPQLGKELGEVYEWLPPCSLGKAQYQNLRTKDVHKFKERSLLLRLFLCFVSDFYRPQTLGDIHQSIFPDRYFHPKSSVDCIHQALRRLRSFFQVSEIPLIIQEQDSAYALVAAKPFKIQVDRPGMTSHRLPVVLEECAKQLKHHFSNRKFTSLQAAKVFASSRNTALTRLQKLTQLNLIKKFGGSKNIHYCLS